MKNSFNDIDNFLRNSFEDFTSEPSPALKSKVSASVRNFNFFRFNPMSFNIFYLVALIVGTGTIVSFATKSNDSSYAKRIVSPIENQFKTMLINNELREEQLTMNEIKVESEIKPQTNINLSNTSTNSQKNAGVDATDKNSKIFKNVEINTIENNSNTIKDQINVVEFPVPFEKNVIFDTIIEEEKSTILDTISVEVRKSVEFKRKRKSSK